MPRTTSNVGFTQIEPLITVDQLKKRYLSGIIFGDLTDKELQNFINVAVSMLEHDLDLAIMPRAETEFKDYQANDYYGWGYFQLNRYPVIAVQSIKVVYLTEGSYDECGNLDTTNSTILDIPAAWRRLQHDSGIVRLVPNNRFPAGLQVDSGGAFFPELFRRHSMVPDLWEIKYTHGFREGKVPSIVNLAIGYIASIIALSNASNFVLGAGIAGSSISLDGLSQAIQTTQSAEYGAYSAQRKEYFEMLYGRRENDPSAIITTLRNYYKGATIQII